MRVTRLAAVTVLASAALLIPAGAHADAYEGYDHAKDVSFLPMTPDDESSGGDYLHAPTRVIGDIIRIRAEHTASKVRISQTYRALPAAGIHQVHELYIYTQNKAYRVGVTARPGKWSGTASLTLDGGEAVKCPGLIHRIDYAHARIIAEVPRSCIGNPTSVQVAGQITVSTEGGAYVDYALWPDLEKFPASPSIKR